MTTVLKKISLEKQTIELPGTRKPGQTGIYRHPLYADKLVISSNPKITTLYENFRYGLKISKDRPFLGTRVIDPKTGKRGVYVWQTYRQVANRVTNLGSGLVHLAETVARLPKLEKFPVGIWSTNRPEWCIADTACSSYNLFTISLYDTLGPDTVEYVINHAEIPILITSADHIISLIQLSPKIPGLQIVISMDSLEDDATKWAAPNIPTKASALKAWAAEKGIYLIDITAVEELGKKNKRKHNPPKPDDLACIMYTSGTTGVPKGAMLTHENFTASASGTTFTMPFRQEDVVISYLPLAHIFGRMCDLSAIKIGAAIGYFSGDINLLVEDMQTLRPTVMISVPRLLNRIYAKIVSSSVEAPGVVGILARKAVADKLANLEAGRGFTHPIWDRLLFNKMRLALGGRVRSICCGSAPIAKEILSFLRIAFCCEIYEGYGATETCATASVTHPGEYRGGHLGSSFPCNEIKLVDVPEMNYLATDPYPRGEICIRGKNVFVGYYKDPKKTEEALDKEGWYYSGDIGMIDERGAIVIIDRKKNIFKLAQGMLQVWDSLNWRVMLYFLEIMHGFTWCSLNPLTHFPVHGDSLQNQLVAIIVPDPLVFVPFGQKVIGVKRPFEELVRDDRVRKATLVEMDKTAKEGGLQGFECVKAIYIDTVPFSIENDLLTPTLKVKRPQCAGKYRIEIDALYRELMESAKDGNQLLAKL
ncbi:hypothetical protein BC938DRAFT_480622 [Jimgerdemannia flammicorona]|uniref:AMP-dependent synthetase/ligase domain-containing protein n=1 Tax=Jimgerdemannia flammicorona TaxID=994334 RepID=A0A433QXE7_9FUNG|nr:hypothetical protein BC938DRAFT_480622 [Jimgerdemannia flammicorona]